MGHVNSEWDPQKTQMQTILAVSKLSLSDPQLMNNLNKKSRGEETKFQYRNTCTVVPKTIYM